MTFNYQFQNLPELFLKRAEENNCKTIFYFKPRKGRKEEKSFEQLNWNESKKQVEHLALGLIRIGSQPTDNIGILANTCIEWVIADIAIMCSAAITVSLYHTCTPEELLYLINDADLKYIFVEDKKQLEKVLQVYKETKLQGIIVFDEAVQKPEANIPIYLLSEIQHSEDPILASEDKNTVNEAFEINSVIKERIANIRLDDNATIVYTSGTSGQLKGVLLTHKNILAQIQSISSVVPINNSAQHSLLAFLTSAHIFQRIAGGWYFIDQACPIYWCNRIERVAQYLHESNATIILSVPLILEKIKSKILNQIEELPDASKLIVKNALNAAIAFKRAEFKAQSKIVKTIMRLAHQGVYESVLKKVAEKISPTLKVIISGGAPISPATIEFFHALGIYLIEGYGLTENTAVLCANSIWEITMNSVGKPLSGTEIKIAEDGEILAKGDIIFKEYWNKPEATREAFTDDGWFKTGDLGHLDKAGNLFITGRKKDLIVNAGGKKIMPALIEESVRASLYIDQIAVFGDKQRWIGALITLHKEAVLKTLGRDPKIINDEGWEILCESDEVNKLITHDLQDKLKHLAEYEKVQKFKILPQPFSQEKDELTHTMKLKRKVVESNYKAIIDSLFVI